MESQAFYITDSQIEYSPVEPPLASRGEAARVRLPELPQLFNVLRGLWQVRGRSLVVGFEEVVNLDREYIEQWSLWMDLQNLLLTVPAVLRRKGAF